MPAIKSWNPIIGCSPISDGCTHCYAANRAKRPLVQHHTPEYKTVAAWDGTVRFVEKAITNGANPARVRSPQVFLVGTMGDIFHANVPTAWQDRLFAVMALCPQHLFLLQTLRPEVMRAYLSNPHLCDRLAVAMAALQRGPLLGAVIPETALVPLTERWPLPNLWLGVTVETAAAYDRIALLQQTPAAHRYVSAEPLLEELTFRVERAGQVLDALAHIDAVWIGGEFGPQARICPTERILALCQRCEESGVVPWVRHLGSKPTYQGLVLQVRGRGEDGQNWPEALRQYRAPPWLRGGDRVACIEG